MLVPNCSPMASARIFLNCGENTQKASAGTASSSWDSSLYGCVRS